MSSPIRLAVVPVAGLGTRMLPLTRSIPKEMLPLGQKLCIEYIVEELQSCGIEEIVFVVSQGKECVARHFEPNEVLDQRLRDAGKASIADRLALGNKNLRIQMAYQEQQLGLGHAVLCAREAVGGRPFVVALGDAIIETRKGIRVLDRMLAEFSEQAAGAVIAFQKVATEQVSRFGIAQPQGAIENGRFTLQGLIEKPSPEQAPSDWAICARYVLHPNIFDELEHTGRGMGGEIQLTDAMQNLIQGDRKGYGVCLSEAEQRIDVGSIPGYLEAFVKSALNDPEHGNRFRQKLNRILATRDSESELR